MDMTSFGGGGGKKDPNAFEQAQSRLNLVSSVKFQSKVEHFSWSPKTFISTLKPTINYVTSDNTQSLIFCTANLNEIQRDPENSNVKTKV